MYLILIAGLPASGKTTFSKYLSEKLNLPTVSKDEIKEELYDTIGFKNREEKVKLGVASMNIMYYFAESMMKRKKSIILENNFENISRQKLEELIEKYDYKVITVLLEGNIKKIYERFKERDKSGKRHRGHVINTQYPEIKEDTNIEKTMTLEEFEKGFKARGIDNFTMKGPVIKIDTSDFEKINYDDVLNSIKDLLYNKK